MSKIIQNAMLIKQTGEIIKSSSRHDMVISSNGDYIVDGGYDYIHQTDASENFVEYLNIFDNDTIEESFS